MQPDKRVLVTGGHGFLGQHLCRELPGAITPSHKDYDLTNQADVARMFDDHTPDVIIHLAAEVGGIGANRNSPGRFFYANMIMGANLIEESRIRGVGKFVQLGTVCSYPKFCPVPFREEDLWEGYPEETNAPYGIAKKSLLVMLQAYRAQYEFPGIYLIPVNLYGPNDNFALESSHVIPAMIRKFYEAKERNLPEVELWGTGRASREFLYVEDAAKGIALALRDYNGARPVNLGTGQEITISDLADKIKSLVGYEGNIWWDTTKPDGQPRRKLDTSRAKEFGFSAITTLDEGLRRTVEWYRCTQAA